MRTKDEGSSEKQLCSIRMKSTAHPENFIRAFIFFTNENVLNFFLLINDIG